MDLAFFGSYLQSVSLRIQALCKVMLNLYSENSAQPQSRSGLKWHSEFPPRKSSTQSTTVVPPITRPSRIALLCEWLRKCDEFHSCIRRSVTIEESLPSRLLFVGNTNDPDSLRIDLVTEIEETKYCALSHRWGTLSKDEEQEFCTTKDNLTCRLKHLSNCKLPKTFQDAVWVTRQLQVPYLWIDSLCIIQAGDDGKDWKFESERMEGVFSSAYCTIAATSARDIKDGFLNRSQGPEYLYIQDSSKHRFYVCAGADNFDEDVNHAELNSRAWVMQERVLSRRTVHFSANGIYWECGEGVCCETLVTMKGG
jgi:hypothetical protein